MRRLTLLACLLACSVALSVWAEPPSQPGQRGQRGGRPQGIDPEQVLENFEEIVALIVTDDEEGEWDDLDTDEQKQAFVVSFWERRDPTPGTTANEFRDIYMQRVAVAARRFRESVPGYRTDRGKVFIIYGSPLQQETRQGLGGRAGVGVPSASEDPTAAAGRSQGGRQGGDIIWKMNIANNPYLEGKEQVVFSAMGGRSYVLRTSLELSEEAFLAGKDIQDWFARAGAGPAASEAARTAVALPPEAVAMRRLLDEGVSQQDLTLEQTFSFFPAPDGTFMAVQFEVGKQGLTFGAEGDAPADMRVFALFIRDDPETGERPLGDMAIDFVVRPDEGDEQESATRSFGLTLVPGNYRLAWGVMDRASNRLTIVSDALEVPDFSSGGLRLTSIIAANSGPTRAAEPYDVNKVYEGVRIGVAHLQTDLDRVFGRNENIELLYFAQGFQLDPNTQQPSLEVNHRILTGTGDPIARLPTQTLNYFAIGQQIPLGQVQGLEPGSSYKIQITVKDLVSGSELIEEVPFSIRGESTN